MNPIQSAPTIQPIQPIQLEADAGHGVDEPIIETNAEGLRPGPRIASLSRILRGIGAAVLVASASTFLLQQWDSGGDLVRYFTLLAHPVLLAVVGFGWGLRAGDAKGARTFLALAAGLVPAVFCVLGGLVYSQFSWDGAAQPAARYAIWMAPSASAAVLAAVVSLAALAPVVVVAFSALVRSRARSLGLAYLAANAVMLVPTRDASVVAALAAASLAGLMAVELRLVRRDSALRTLEGTFVRSMLFAAPALILLRGALHYETSLFFLAVVSAAGALLTFAASQASRLPAPVRELLRSLALAPIGASCALATGALMGSTGLPDAAALPIAGLGFGGVVTSLSLLAGEAEWGHRYRRTGAVGVVGAMALDLALFPSVLASFACLVTSIVVLSHGWLRERRAVFMAGAAGALWAAAWHVRWAVELYAWSRWGSLAFVGICVILAAFVVERHATELTSRAAALRRRFAGWD